MAARRIWATKKPTSSNKRALRYRNENSRFLVYYTIAVIFMCHNARKNMG
jgi:hypothetical protein